MFGLRLAQISDPKKEEYVFRNCKQLARELLKFLSYVDDVILDSMKEEALRILVKYAEFFNDKNFKIKLLNAAL